MKKELRERRQRQWIIVEFATPIVPGVVPKYLHSLYKEAS